MSLWLFILFVGVSRCQDIHITSLNLFPESFDWDPEANKWLIGSLTARMLNHVDDEGNLEEAASEPNFKSVTGVYIDHKAGVAYVCNGDFNKAKQTNPKAEVYAFSLGSYDELWSVDVGALDNPTGTHFCNDLVVDNDGNIYATDSFNPNIWKISPDGKEAAVWVSNAAWNTPALVGLDGIAFHPDLNLIVVNHLASSSLWRIPINEDGSAGNVTMIDWGVADVVLSPDGQRFHKGELLLVNGSSAWRFASDDDWFTITSVMGPVDVEGATAIAMRGDVPHALIANLKYVLAGGNWSDFDIVELTDLAYDSGSLLWLWLLLGIGGGAVLLIIIVALVLSSGGSSASDDYSLA